MRRSIDECYLFHFTRIMNGFGGYAANWYGYCNGQQTGTEDSCSMNDWTIPDEALNFIILNY